MADQCLGPVPTAIRYKLLSLLRPYPADEMTANPISALVNSPKNDVPACIEASA
jgi:putative SOS response-associated peptidase YedK